MPHTVAMIPGCSMGATGGPTSYIGALVGQLREAGHQVTLLTWNKLDGGSPPRSRIATMIAMFRSLCSFHPDVVHIHGQYRFIVPALMYRNLRKRHTRLIFTFHSAPRLQAYLPDSRKPGCELGGVLRLPTRVLLRACDRVCTVSDSIVRDLNRAFDLKIRNYVVIPSGGQPLTTEAASVQSFVKRYGLAESFPIVGTTGVMYLDAKVLGQQHCIEATKRLIGEFPKIRLLIAGDGPYRPYLENVTRDLGLENNVTFLGNVPDLSAYLATIDLYAHMAQVEGCPLSIVEAMWARKAIIAANCGGMPELITSGVSGILIEPSAENLAQTMMALARDPARRKELARRAFDFARDNLSWPRIARQYLDLYQ